MRLHRTKPLRPFNRSASKHKVMGADLILVGLVLGGFMLSAFGGPTPKVTVPRVTAPKVTVPKVTAVPSLITPMVRPRGEGGPSFTDIMFPALLFYSMSGGRHADEPEVDEPEVDEPELTDSKADNGN